MLGSSKKKEVQYRHFGKYYSSFLLLSVTPPEPPPSAVELDGIPGGPSVFTTGLTLGTEIQADLTEE